MNYLSSSRLDITTQTTIATIAKLIRPYNLGCPDCEIKSQECWAMIVVTVFPYIWKLVPQGGSQKLKVKRFIYLDF